MKAAIFEKFGGPITIGDVPDPQVPSGGVVVKVEATGICRSDWHGWMGHDPDIKVPHVPGHELAGVIEQVGSGVRKWKSGDRVTVPFSVGCGSCPECLSGNQQICDDYFQPGFTAWGSFAEYVAIRYADANLVQLPGNMDFVEAASLGCRFITAFRAVVAQGRVQPGEWVVVHGCGGLGLSAVMIARALGANVIGVDIAVDALAMASAAGASKIINVQHESNLVERIQDITGGGAHVSVDALGSTETSRNSVLCLRKRGRHVQVGLMVEEYKDALVPMNEVIAKELEIRGSHGMQAYAYKPMLEMIRGGKLNPKQLVRKTVSLGEAPAQLAGMTEFKNTGVIVINKF